MKGAGRLYRRRSPPRMPFEDRQRAAREKAEAIVARKCPGCGALCKWHNGNAGARERCERCGS